MDSDPIFDSFNDSWNISNSSDTPTTNMFNSIEPLGDLRFVSHSVLIIVGIPLNVLVLFVISYCRHLRIKPRNIFLLGISAANLLCLLTILIELVAHYYRNMIACHVFIATTGVAYTSLLCFIVLALACRYSAIVRPLRHKRRFSVDRVSTALIGTFLLVTVVIKFPFLFLGAPIECDFLLHHNKIIIVADAVLFALCVVGQIAVYLKVKQCIALNRHIPIKNAAVEVARKQSPQHHGSTSAPTPTPNTRRQAQRAPLDTCLRVHVGQQRVTKMEIKATWTLIHGVCSMIVFTLPMLVLCFVEWGCKTVHGENECGRIVFWSIHTRELLLYHLIYYPLMNMYRNRDLSIVWRKLLRPRRRTPV